MQKLNSFSQLAIGALSGIIILHMVMLLALFARVEPHPPAFVGPLIGATLAFSTFTISLIWSDHSRKLIALITSMLMALPSVGPHKFLTEPEALVLSPVILSGTAFLILLTIYIVESLRRQE